MASPYRRRLTRLAACEPCRQLKVACDHGKPACLRCARKGQPESCVYRARPFTRHREKEDTPTRNPIASHSSPSTDGTSPSGLVPREALSERRYPNTGHLGVPSSATIFSCLGIDEGVQETCLSGSTPNTPIPTRACRHNFARHDEVLRQVYNAFGDGSLKRLVDFWLAKGVALSLGGPFLECCLQSLQRLANGKLFNTTDISAISQRLSETSATSPTLSSASTLLDFDREISDVNLRWESVALGLIAAGRATTDIPFFPPLYTSQSEMCAFRRAVTELADRCLDIAIELDSLDDLKLICQYESFILHSVVDGDQSTELKVILTVRRALADPRVGYSVWRRLGDVISSLLFLGLNERIIDSPELPRFLTELRRTVFAQIYSDDKNMAVFLGRPPRLSRKFCCFQLPGSDQGREIANDPPERPMAALSYQFFDTDNRPDSVTGLRWKACCASLKEEILETLQEYGQQSQERILRFDAIYDRALSLWQSLPDHLKIEQTLSPHGVRSPFENDFLVDIRLTYLQVLFLLKSSIATYKTGKVNHAEAELLQISQEMLSLTVEAIVLRDQLVNSGTSLLWKVAHYGLPAAGAICLCMLRPTFWQSAGGSSIPKILQNLGVLSLEIRLGGILHPEAPNYNLLYRAANTIQGLLETALSLSGSSNDRELTTVDAQSLARHDEALYTGNVDIDLMGFSDSWGCEIGFWQDLSVHSA